MSGVALGRYTLDALESIGITASGWQWIHRRGIEGGTYEPHKRRNRRIEATPEDFPDTPETSPNYRYCQCSVIPVFRDVAGRFTRPGLEHLS